MRKTQRKTPPEPGSAAARQAARRKRRIRRRIIRTTIVLVVLLLLTLLGFLIFDYFSDEPLLAVKVIEVEGESRYTDEEIIEASGIRVGQNLLDVSKAEAHNAILERFPYLDYVDVGNSSFHNILIQVRETKVMGVAETAAGFMVVGENNHALELITDETALPADAVRIRGAVLLEETVGKSLLEERSLKVCTELLAAAQQFSLTDLTAIDITEKTDIRIVWRNQIQVVLGNESNLSMQIKAFAGLLPTLLGNNGDAATGRLDMSSYADDDSANDRAVFSPMSWEEMTAPPPEEMPEDDGGATTPSDTVTDAEADTAATDAETTPSTAA